MAASGLTPTIAPSTIRRLLANENILPPESVTPAQFERALPALVAALRVYLDRNDHERVQRDLTQLVA